MAPTRRDARRALTAQRILEAARAEFAANGFDATTIRGIAAEAGVDASLVMQHYGSKAELFAVAVQLPGAGEVGTAEHLFDVLGVRLGQLPPELHALVRSMLTVPEATEAMRVFLDERVDNLARSIGTAPDDASDVQVEADARLRSLLAVSGILGLTITQHFLKLHAFDDVSHDDLLRAAQAWLESATSRT